MSCSLTERVQENAGGGGGTSGGGSSTAGSCRLRGSSNSKQSRSKRATAAVAASNATSNGGGGGSTAGVTVGGTGETSPPPPPPRPKPCLCWCCCCGCNCSTPGKGNDENNGPSKNSNSSDINCEDEPPISIEEIRTWGRSFDKLMRSAGGRKVFREFLKCEYSEENILFWMACEDLKAETNVDGVEEKARVIYEDYISILSPKEVSLDSRVREIVNRNMMAPTPNTFDEAQLQIYTLMHRDSYPRFVNSAMYKQLAQTQQQTTHQTPAGGSESSNGDNAARDTTAETASTG